MAEVILTNPVLHDGDTKKRGEVLSGLSDKEAKRLVDLGFAKNASRIDLEPGTWIEGAPGEEIVKLDKKQLVALLQAAGAQLTGKEKVGELRAMYAAIAPDSESESPNGDEDDEADGSEDR